MSKLPKVQGDWLVIQIDETETIKATRPTLSFDKGGRVSGSTGLNRLTGSFVQDGPNIEFGQPATTRMAGPPEVMEQENLFLEALREPMAVSQDKPKELLLTSASHKLILIASPEESEPSKPRQPR